MLKKHTNILHIALILTLVSLTQVSFAKVTPIQQQVLDDYMTMKNMSSQQRKDYRSKIYANKSRQQTKAYTKAFKQVRGMLPEYLNVTNKTDPAKTGNKTTPKSNKKSSPSKRAMGGITYDTGTVTGTAGLASQMLGNRFDSALNTAGTMCCFPVEDTGSITMITFNMANTFFSSAVWSLYSNVMGTTAMRITNMGKGVMTGLNTLSVMSPTTANAYMNGTFLAGIFQNDPATTGLAVDTGTTGGQGFHAISINDGTTGTMLTAIVTRNAIFRVTGNIPTPVELQNFTIE